ncbi:MAG TPA: glutathione S-transferase family protein [Solirubrobacteraceae bacterium]|nr:glutathione S-transferase family protein [Solirubrobacteraceae bacterium]
MRLYHRNGAGRPIRLAWTLEEAGADYEVVVISPEEGQSPEHLARQPLGRVPALVDDEGPLFESTALCLHVGELYPDSGLLPPEGSHERALVQQWSIFAMTELEGPALDAIRHREKHPEASEKAQARAAKSVAALEQALSGTPPRLVGDQLTVADIVAGDVLRMTLKRFELVPSTSLLDEYIASLLERPARERAIARLNS